jgi:hypothetical protein
MLAWQCLVRAYQILGAPTSADLRTDLKNELNIYITQASNELKGSLAKGLLSVSRSGDFSAKGSSVIQEAIHHSEQKHDIEIKLYVDSLDRRSTLVTGTSTQYNFYGNVGAVQTGDSSTANIVQNLGDGDKSALLEALALTRDAITAAAELPDIKRRELVEITKECEGAIKCGEPNNTKLLTLFNVLALTVQSLASAQPAYDALKTALLPLGVRIR